MFVNLRQAGQPAVQQAVQRGGLRSSYFFRNGIVKDSPILNQWLEDVVSGQASAAQTLRRVTWQPGRTHEEIPVHLERNRAWDARTLSSVPPIAEQYILDFWGRRLHKAILATLGGVLASNGAVPRGTGNQFDLLWNTTGAGVYLSGVTNLDEIVVSDVLRASKLHAQNDITDLVMHSAVYTRLTKTHLLDTRPDGVYLPSLGLRLIADDGLPNPSPGVYDSYLVGPGLLEFGEAEPLHSRQRVSQMLYDRIVWCIHPMGHGFSPAFVAAGGPDNSNTPNNLAHADSWVRTAALREHIPFACLRTREF